MTAALYVIGAVPFIILGGLHGLYTVIDEFAPRRLAPKDTSLIEALRMAPLGITQETNMWRAWIGFNLSHSLGAVAFGLLYAYLAIAHAEFLMMAGPLLWAAPLIGAVYIYTAWRYWFSVPLIGVCAGTASFIAGALTANSTISP